MPEPVIWKPPSPASPPGPGMPSWGVALRRGLLMRCPVCGGVSAFDGYIEIREACPRCRAPLGLVPCDLLAPYLTIIVGLVVVGVLMAAADRGGGLGYARSLEVFIPVAIILSLALLRPIKGLVLAYMLKLRMINPP